MRSFIQKIALFIIPTILGLSLIYTIDIPRYYSYYYTKNDGCLITWIYDRIYSNTKPIDVVFLGSSHTGCGINDAQMDSLVSNESVVNLSYCQGGRSIHYTVLKDILLNHQPKKVILEVRMEEDFTSHRDFGTVGYLGDVFNAPVIGNPNYLKDIYKGFQVRYMFFQDNIMDVLPKEPTFNEHFDYSHLSLFNGAAPIEQLNEHYEWQINAVTNHNNGPIRKWRLMYPMNYLSKIKSLCTQNNVELIFLYIPSFGMAAEKPFNLKEYEKLAPVMLPPKQLFSDPNLWMDTEHFNSIGARKLTTWVSEQLIE